MKDRIVKTIIADIKGRHNNNEKKYKTELNKLMKFVKESDYFKGKKRDLYKIIIKARKNSRKN